MNICVFGAASPKIDESYINEVERLGRLMADRGHGLVFGAGGNGLMGAVARGVYAKGGEIHGVIPTFFKEEEVEAIFESCTKITYTESMRERKQIMEDEADAFIVTPGGIGTFEEFYEILTLKQLGRHTKPIVIFNINGYYDELLTVMDCSVKKGFINESCLELYMSTKDADQALDYAELAPKIGYSVKDLKEG